MKVDSQFPITLRTSADQINSYFELMLFSNKAG